MPLLLLESGYRRLPTPSPRSRRSAATTLFALDGLIFGSWAARIPDLATQVGAGHATLGLILLCVSVGALATMQLTGMLCVRLGAGAVSVIAAVLTSIAIALPGLAATVSQLAAAVLGLGAATGMLNVSINAVGVRVELAAGRSVVPSMHAVFSLGGLAGAVLTTLAQPHLSVATHLVVLGAAGLVVTAAVAPVVIGGDERVAPGTRPVRLPTAIRRAVLVFGIVAACTAFGEGGVTDWGALYLREVLGADAGLAAAGYACFSIAMATGRFAGGRLLDRFGTTALLVGGSLLAAAGALLVAAAPGLPLTVIGFAVVGLGLANVFPAAIGRAGALGGSGGVALASTVGYAGLLGGPPLLGFLAHASGLSAGFVVIAVLAATAAGLALLAPPESRSASALLDSARRTFARLVLVPATDRGCAAVRDQGRALAALWPIDDGPDRGGPTRDGHDQGGRRTTGPHRPAAYPGLELLVR